MLSAGQRSVIPICRRDIYRALSTTTETDSASTSTSHLPQRRENQLRQRKREFEPSTNSGRLFVRPWDGIPSMPDALAMVRGIERRYGKVKSFKLARDPEQSTIYLPFLWAELEDPRKFTGTEVIHVPIPDVDRRRPGGVGLDDLQGLLEYPYPNEPEEVWRGVTQEMMSEARRAGKARVFDLRVELSASEETVDVKYISPNKKLLVSDAFIKWGGFASAADVSLPHEEMKNRIPVRERKSDPAEQGLPNLDLVEQPQPPLESKPFNYAFDEPTVKPIKRISQQEQVQRREPAANVSMSQTIKEKQNNGTPLSNRERTLMQAALIARTPPPPMKAKPRLIKTEPITTKVNRAEGVEGPVEIPGEGKMETEEDKKGFQDKLWKLVGGRWF